MADAIQVFRLVSGEEVMTRVEPSGSNDDHYIFIKPRAMMMQVAANGAFGVTLIPLFAANQDGKVKVYKSAIAGEALEHDKELEKSYVSQTTGIALA